ncbi:hypothetical protein D4R78_02285 [bacterium]|nr:MAG: hypothetical protein D4R78_02285 [bacterium]
MEMGSLGKIAFFLFAHTIGILAFFYIYNDAIKRYPTKTYALLWAIPSYFAALLVIFFYFIFRFPIVNENAKKLTTKNKLIIYIIPLIIILMFVFLPDSYSRGSKYLNNKKYAEAEAVFTECIKKDSSDIPAYKYRILSYIGLKEYDKAWEDVNTVKRLGSKVEDRLLNLLEKLSGRNH